MKQILIRGTLSIMPLVISIWLIWSIAVALDDLGSVVIELLGVRQPWPGTGFLLIFLMILLSGMAFSVSPFRWLFQTMEQQIMRFPLLSTVYGSIKDVASVLQQDSGTIRRQTVLVRQDDDTYIVGFVTNDVLPEALSRGLPELEGNDQWVPVLYQVSYQVAGVTILARRSDLIELDWSFNEAMTFMVTAGISRKPTRYSSPSDLGR